MSSENQPPASPRPDLAGRADIERLVDTFYGKVREDELIGFIFNDVAKTDWAAHLPKMYAFWEAVLFRTGNFSGNPVATHARLVPLTTMGPAQFARWLQLFTATVDELFAGEKATLLKASAADIANVLHTKINKLPPTSFDYSQLTPEQRAHYATQPPKIVKP